MPCPWRKKPDTSPGPVQLPVNDLCHFGNAGAAEHIRDDRDNALPRYSQALLHAQVEPVCHTPVHIPRGGERECPGGLCVKAFHRHTEQFAGNIDTAPEKWELRDAFADRVAGMRKQFRGEGEILGGGHECVIPIGRKPVKRFSCGHSGHYLWGDLRDPLWRCSVTPEQAIAPI
jgi:hypothetical protein